MYKSYKLVNSDMSLLHLAGEVKSYMNENHLSEPLQSAYKVNHSTETALLKVFNDILSRMDDRKVVLLSQCGF